ncbi:ATP synthase subunit I [Candidatus Acetothermia bacterium]|jgi:low temperature requirement protein LtrA|nr:ATP synthase subunit I [Candidatus Acetothermia bacterium]MCI2426037.1 ATP synthase subunit I [Candidatus Acetothermia bacterium]MCI2427711.1 ATP synthase subunit I [Candidatus Acetothermia bacterium]MCI2428986.1 ATP synthase subunit I [Candidatus Acetothermia bacterium]
MVHSAPPGHKDQRLIDIFCLRELSLVLLLAIIATAIFGTRAFLFGFLYGVTLFLVNGLFLVEMGKLISQHQSRQVASKIAVVGFIGRYLFLAVMLVIAAYLPQVDILAVCAGLLFTQLVFFLLLVILLVTRHPQRGKRV